jgi:hypothetical protein
VYSVRFASWSVVKGLMLSTLVVVFMILPWTVRNYKAFDTFVLLNTNAGFAFYWGNHPVQGTKFIPLIPISYQDLIPPELLSLNEGKLDRALLEEGIQIVLNDPFRYIILSLSRIEEFFKFWPSPDSGIISNISRVGSFGVLLPFMIVGILLSIFKPSDSINFTDKTLIILIYLFIVFYTILHVLSWTLIRYRLPVDAFLVIFAALGISHITRLVHKWL